MSALIQNLVRCGVILAMLVLFSIGSSADQASIALAQTAPNDGLVCTSDASPNPTFTLTTQTGYIATPDDNVVYMWGFSAGGGGFQHPSPVLCVNQGDTVTVILQNSFDEDVSIVFPGQENVLANGAPVQPQFTGTTLDSLAQVAPANGGSVTYSFVASEPGTYIYQSGTNPAKQINMGLYGVLVVRPTRGAGFAYQTGDNEFNPSTEFMVLLSEIDPLLNQAVERNRPFNMNNYKPRYYLLNGRGFPDAIAPNFASWLPSQPYGALVRVHPLDATANPLPALVRYINVTSQDMPIHPHGNHTRVIARGGRPLVGPGGEDLSFEKFSVNIGPGQTWDTLSQWQDAENYSETNPVPVTIPNIYNLVYGTFYGGSPYLGVQGEIPVGTGSQNACGEMYIISHNHSLYQITSWGVPMTGPITYMRVDPPLPNNCP